MKKAVPKLEGNPAMKAEYDFTGGERGKYADRYGKKASIVVLDPDMAKVFPNSDAVNDRVAVACGDDPQQPCAFPLTMEGFTWHFLEPESRTSLALRCFSR